MFPDIGQIAMTQSEEVVAAGPSGLFYFKRIRDHDSTPWSAPRPLPDMPWKLDNSSVSGLAIYRSFERLNVYCVSNGYLRTFYRSITADLSFTVDPVSPFPSYLVSGTPAVALIDGNGKDDEYDYDCDYDDFRPERWSLIVSCQSGGLLHTSTTNELVSGQTVWQPAELVATDLGVISAVSIAAIRTENDFHGYPDTKIVAVCIAGAQLHTVEGFLCSCWYDLREWYVQTSTRIHHPGEVTGNPVLVKGKKNQLDLLVPSAEGGVFHFVRTASTPNEWHMIERITFPQGLPAASCLALIGKDQKSSKTTRFRALIQIKGRLYHITTHEGSWSGTHLKPLLTPGPFSD